ncbi:DNA polymerase-4 [Prosthecobacter fusiformis]|uniref:DNA polymerase-4 n=1 Tax=Prosthecobacter fusiformis TaxID=48464 RepID=A0A4R7RJF6_9BACT|nr:impB/mucB/samB family protein [Prosthecobacter fusiformis]TDU64248.1 DNA polymerase-4 [Prosthecobacter fusiformis]
MTPVPNPGSAAPLRWLFVDLNSYFASVEQQLRPELRGRPVIVVPVMSDHTCAIAASYQAKKFGVKTGTNVGDAKRMCPGLAVVEASHGRYVDFHHKIIDEIERHYPVQVIGSIDEMGCLLDRKRAPEEVAVALARRIKRGLLDHVGEVITCSVGIATNRYLAKVASDLTKPDGLEVVRVEDLPGRLAHLKLTDLPGIGRNMEPRLHEAKIHTFLDLWQATPRELHRVWGGVGGDRFWHQLHGGDLDDVPVQNRSIGHSHVLSPEFRQPPEAAIVSKRLLLKAASRLRRMGYRATQLSLSVRAESTLRGEAHQRFLPVSDSFALTKTLNVLWPEAMDQIGWSRVKKIGVTLHGLEANSAPQQMDLFPELGSPIIADVERRDKLSKIMDDLNQEYGRDSIALGFAPDSVKSFSGTKIAFTRIPERQEFKE